MRQWIAVLFLLLFFAPFRARADEAIDVKKRAQEGRDLFAKGDYAGAIVAFSQVYRETHEAKYLFNLALAEYAGQRTFDAWQHFEELIKKPDATAANIAEAQRVEQEIAPKLEHLAVDAPGGATVLVDGVVVGTAPLARAITVDPDKGHTIVARLGTEETKKDIAPVGPKSVQVELAFAPPPSAPPEAATVAAPPPIAKHEASPARIWLTVGLGVAAAASLGTAIAFGVVSSNDHSDAEQLRAGMSTSACTTSASGTCTNLLNAVNAMGTNHTLSQVFYSGAGVFAAGAIASWFFMPKDRTVVEHASLTPIVSPQFIGLTVSEVF